MPLFERILQETQCAGSSHSLRQWTSIWWLSKNINMVFIQTLNNVILPRLLALRLWLLLCKLDGGHLIFPETVFALSSLVSAVKVRNGLWCIWDKRKGKNILKDLHNPSTTVLKSKHPYGMNMLFQTFQSTTFVRLVILSLSLWQYCLAKKKDFSCGWMV